IRNRLRQVGDMPLWSAPVTRRSVSLLQNHVTGPEHLESIVEDSALYRIPDVGTQSMGRGSRDRPRPSVNLSSPRTPMYMPAYYAYLQGVSSSGWSRQGSSYFTGSVNATGSQGPGTIQASRSSIDAGTGSLWTGDVPEQVKTIDPLHVDMLYRLLYRLGILAVESDTEAVLPSFEYFVAHQDDDLSSYRIHRASTVSIGSIQHHGARCQQPQNGGMPESELMPDNEQRPTPVASPTFRSRSVSPSLVQSTMAMSLNRQPPLTTDEQPCVPEKDVPDMQLSIALNEPPVPLYLTEDMSQQHLVAILAMLVRQLECAVDVLDSRMQDVRVSPPVRNDSKMDGGITGDGALQNALEQVAKGNHGLDSVGIEWTKEHVLSALESYLNRLMHQSEH
ncbi:hypothetical protein LPJ71_007128, partial [Coemansia sp. S17]